MTTENAEGVGLLVVGHGTRNVQGQAQFLSLVDQVASRIPSMPVAPAFLELAQPDIPQGIERLAGAGCRRILVVPLLLFSAGHAKRDIPDAVQEAARGQGIEVLGQTDALGLHPPLLALSAKRFSQAIGADQASKGQASRVDLDEPTSIEPTALVMLGRGASDLTAVRAMRQLTVLRKCQSRCSYAGAGFFAIAKPTVEQIFQYAATRHEKRIVVQPHLLFDGELMEQARSWVKKYQEITSGDAERGHTWYLCEPLGHDASDLAQVMVDIAQDLLSQSIR